MDELFIVDPCSRRATKRLLKHRGIVCQYTFNILRHSNFPDANDTCAGGVNVISRCIAFVCLSQLFAFTRGNDGRRQLGQKGMTVA